MVQPRVRPGICLPRLTSSEAGPLGAVTVKFVWQGMTKGPGSLRGPSFVNLTGYWVWTFTVGVAVPPAPLSVRLASDAV